MPAHVIRKNEASASQASARFSFSSLLSLPSSFLRQPSPPLALRFRSFRSSSWVRVMPLYNFCLLLPFLPSCSTIGTNFIFCFSSPSSPAAPSHPLPRFVFPASFLAPPRFCSHERTRLRDSLVSRGPRRATSLFLPFPPSFLSFSRH